MEEYEAWKQQQVKSGAHTAMFRSLGFTGVAANHEFAILNILPEFNMEKNMPVEDDDNLARKKEEW